MLERVCCYSKSKQQKPQKLTCYDAPPTHGLDCYLGINESWDVIRASYCNLAGDGDRFEEAMTKYEEQPRVKTFTAFAETEEGRRLLGYSSQVDDFNATRTDYIQQHRHAAATTSAVVMNGHWYDSFGKDPQTWHSIYAKMLNQIPDSTYLTVVDCHR